MSKSKRPAKPRTQHGPPPSPPSPADNDHHSPRTLQPAEDPDWDEWDDVDPPDDLSEPWSLPEDELFDEREESEPEYGDFCIDFDEDDQ